MKVKLRVSRYLDETMHHIVLEEGSDNEKELLRQIFLEEPLPFGQLEESSTHVDKKFLLYGNFRGRRDNNFVQRITKAAKGRNVECSVEVEFNDYRPAQKQREKDHVHDVKSYARSVRKRDERNRTTASIIGISMPIEVPVTNHCWERLMKNHKLIKSVVVPGFFSLSEIYDVGHTEVFVNTISAPLRPMNLLELGQCCVDRSALTHIVGKAVFDGDKGPLLDNGALNVFVMRTRGGIVLVEIWMTAGGWMMNVTDCMAKVYYQRGTKVFRGR